MITETPMQLYQPGLFNCQLPPQTKFSRPDNYSFASTNGSLSSLPGQQHRYLHDALQMEQHVSGLPKLNVNHNSFKLLLDESSVLGKAKSPMHGLLAYHYTMQQHSYRGQLGQHVDAQEVLYKPMYDSYCCEPLLQGKHSSQSGRTDFMKLLSEKYGEECQQDGRPMHEDPDPKQIDNELSMSMDDSIMEVSCLKGQRVDPHLRISQVDKILMRSENLTSVQRRSLVSRRNTAKLRLRQKKERAYSMLIRVQLDVIANAVSTTGTQSATPSAFYRLEFLLTPRSFLLLQLREKNVAVFPQKALSKPVNQRKTRPLRPVNWSEAKQKVTEHLEQLQPVNSKLQEQHRS